MSWLWEEPLDRRWGSSYIFLEFAMEITHIGITYELRNLVDLVSFLKKPARLLNTDLVQEGMERVSRMLLEHSAQISFVVIVHLSHRLQL